MTKEEIEEEIKKMGLENIIISNRDGSFTVRLSGVSAITNIYGAEAFIKVLQEETKKFINGE